MLKITYKECINLGVFDYTFDGRKFPISSYTIMKPHMNNRVSRATKNQYVF